MQKTLTNAFRFCLPPGMEKYWEGWRRGEEGEQHKGGTGSASVLGIKLNFFIGIFKCASASAPVVKATGRLAIWNIKLGYIPKSAHIFLDIAEQIPAYISVYREFSAEFSREFPNISFACVRPLQGMAESSTAACTHAPVTHMPRKVQRKRGGKEDAGCYGGWTAKAISSNKW